jgi:hypothetical protein
VEITQTLQITSNMKACMGVDGVAWDRDRTGLIKIQNARMCMGIRVGSAELVVCSWQMSLKA